MTHKTHNYLSLKEAQKAWDARSATFKKSHPLKVPKHAPNIPPITPSTQKNLKIKTLSYLIKNDKRRFIRRYLFKHPLKYLTAYLKALFKRKKVRIDGDFYYYGIPTEAALKQKLAYPATDLLIGFSYCQKPLECPSGRFNSLCANHLTSPTCAQCLIGKVRTLYNHPRIHHLIIPTIYDIGHYFFEFNKKHPEKNLTFVITACPLSLKMFTDFGNMLSLSGIGIALHGRICNTFQAFALAENGIKPGLTSLTSQTANKLIKLLNNFYISF